LDIIEQKIYAKSLLSKAPNFDQSWCVEFIPTALIDNSASEQTIWIVADKGLFLFNPTTGVVQKRLSFELGEDFRTNDAGADKKGNLWVGVMEKQPSGLNGHIFAISKNGDIQQVIANIGIPNTFCWSDELDAMLISDSYQQKTFAVNRQSESTTINEHAIILDLAETEGTPDGGAIDENGALWNANWGLKRAICHDLTGIRRQVDVKALQVASVCFGDKNRDKLLITSATEGLSESQRDTYPHSGSTFLLTDTETQGRKPLGFAMKDQDNVS
jgi:sugar lactone lactonase YvrE